MSMEQLGTAGRAAAGRGDFPKKNRESREPSILILIGYQREELNHHFAVLPGAYSTYPLMPSHF